jgi:hypothetical protein
MLLDRAVEDRLQAFPILNTFVLQVGQVPWVAGRPFFMVMALGALISLVALHFTQYAFILTPPLF